MQTNQYIKFRTDVQRPKGAQREKLGCVGHIVSEKNRGQRVTVDISQRK